MGTIFSKLWPGISLAIIAVLAFLCIKQCRTTPVQVDNSVAVRAAYDSAKRIDSQAIAGLTLQKDSLGDVVESLRAKTTAMQFVLDTMGEHITGTLANLDAARIKHDTIPFYIACDTLEAQVKQGIPAVEGYVHLSDSLVKSLMAEGVIQDSIVAKLTRDNRLASSTITAQQLNYSILSLDDQHKTAQLKIYKPVAIGGMAAVVAFIVLKIIAH